MGPDGQSRSRIQFSPGRPGWQALLHTLRKEHPMRTIIRVLAAGLLVATPALGQDTQKARPGPRRRA